MRTAQATTYSGFLHLEAFQMCQRIPYVGGWNPSIFFPSLTYFFFQNKPEKFQILWFFCLGPPLSLDKDGPTNGQACGPQHPSLRALSRASLRYDLTRRRSYSILAPASASPASRAPTLYLCHFAASLPTLFSCPLVLLRSHSLGLYTLHRWPPSLCKTLLRPWPLRARGRGSRLGSPRAPSIRGGFLGPRSSRCVVLDRILVLLEGGMVRPSVATLIRTPEMATSPPAAVEVVAGVRMRIRSLWGGFGKLGRM